MVRVAVFAFALKSDPSIVSALKNAGFEVTFEAEAMSAEEAMAVPSLLECVADIALVYMSGEVFEENAFYSLLNDAKFIGSIFHANGALVILAGHDDMLDLVSDFGQKVREMFPFEALPIFVTNDNFGVDC